MNRRRVVVLGGLAVVLVALAAWVWWPRAAPEEQRAEVPFPWLRAPTTIEPMPGAAPSATEPHAAASAASGAALPARTAASGPVAHDLCGLGRIVVPGSADGGGDREGGALPQLPAPVGRFAFEDAQRRLLQTLAGGDARLRVAAGLLQQPTPGDPAAEAAWARGLVADALASRDAQALRWAATACPFVDDEGACRRRLVRARVQAEPANALHWLDWAAEEPGSADAAWAGLARAQYWREHPLGLAGVLLAAVPPDVPGYLIGSLSMEAMARDAAFPAPPLDPALQRCRGVTGPDCERLARLLVERGDSVQSLMLGRELGEHAGWAPAQLQRLDDEVAALQKQEHHWAVDDKRPLGCETIERQRQHIAAVQRDGELAVLRRNLAAARPASAAAATGAATNPAPTPR
ncbi:MAG: hypothetical protein IPM15_13505 [Betaproteobacteria bacterium]|nr:hypothetical protein [Betaproteobacteria bacterium]MCC6249018.1 hypothetical protein [Rubrivivax sp.]